MSEQPTTDPAARLQAAATHLRALLADPQLTAGPWLSLDHGDRLLRNHPGDEDAAPIYVVNEPMPNSANAAWIAAMHPGVGEALASVLEQAMEKIAAYRKAAAHIWDADNAEHQADVEEFMAQRIKSLGPAFAVADAILAGAEQ